MTRSEAAVLCTCSERTVSRAVQSGRIGGKWRGREFLLDASDVELFRLSRERASDPLRPLRQFVSDLLERESAHAG